MGDSSVCGANGRSKILERVEYPTIHEVEGALASRTDASPELAAIVIDVAAAHKRVKLQEPDGGLQFFQVGGRLYRYRVCHFGAPWSAHWWARVGALLHRLARRVVYVEHFGFSM